MARSTEPFLAPLSSVDEQLSLARARLCRLEPLEARRAQSEGAVIVDIRPEAQRRAEGEIPGALVIERNVLEWRLDPTSPDRHPAIGDRAPFVVVACQEGYSSSFAAASLQDIGLEDATDLAGGFAAWQAAGLPVLPTTGSG